MKPSKERTAIAEREKDMTREEFIQKAIAGNGVQNDSTDVWVVVDGVQYTVSVDDVLDHEETEPFEASDYLERNLDAPAWNFLYAVYSADCLFNQFI